VRAVLLSRNRLAIAIIISIIECCMMPQTNVFANWHIDRSQRDKIHTEFGSMSRGYRRINIVIFEPPPNKNPASVSFSGQRVRDINVHGTTKFYPSWSDEQSVGRFVPKIGEANLVRRFSGPKISPIGVTASVPCGSLPSVLPHCSYLPSDNMIGVVKYRLDIERTLKDIRPQLPSTCSFTKFNSAIGMTSVLCSGSGKVLSGFSRGPSGFCRIFSGSNGLAPFSHLQKCSESTGQTRQRDGRPKQSIGIIRQISREVDSLPVNFGFLAVTLAFLWGVVGGYYLYYERNLISAVIIGSLLLLCLLGAWFQI